MDELGKYSVIKLEIDEGKSPHLLSLQLVRPNMTNDSNNIKFIFLFDGLVL